LADAFPCPRCGSPATAQARFCGTCGLQLAPMAPAPMAPAAAPFVPAPAAPPISPFAAPAAASTFGQVLSPGGPPSIFHAAPSPSQVVAPGTPRPFGILALALFIAGTSVVTLVVALEFALWSNSDFSYDEFGWGVIDGAFGLAYVIAAVYGFRVIPQLWAIRPHAWRTANLVDLSWLGLNLLGVALWPVSELTVIGLVVMIGILVYLNLTSTRAMFGRPPLVTSTRPA